MGSRDEYDALKEQAETLFDADDWGPSAVRVYEQMIMLNGRNEWAYCRLARCFEVAGDFDRARGLYERVRRFAPQSNCAGRGLQKLDEKINAAAAIAEARRRPEAIRELVEVREIDFLFHFTRAENLGSILEKGLQSQEALREAGTPVVINDEARWDGYPEAICLSIAFPNYKLFHVFRRREPASTWAVIAVLPSVLWELDCAFYPVNAASNSVRFQSRKRRAEFSSLTEMFADPCSVSGIGRFADLPGYCPTHPQAEVLSFDPVTPEYIVGALFETDAAAAGTSVPAEFEARKLVNPSVFRNRVDCDLWW